MAHTKAGGSTKLGRDSHGRRLGVKKNENERVMPGQIIIRQRGTRYVSGRNVARGADDTLYALTGGAVRFITRKKTRFDGSRRLVKVVTVQ